MNRNQAIVRWFDEEPIRRCWIDRLGTLEWRYYLTLSFRKPTSEHIAVRTLHRYLRQARRALGAPVTWWSVLERQGTRPHFHVLLAGIPLGGESRLRSLWPANTHVVAFDPTRAAKLFDYITKEVPPAEPRFDGPLWRDLPPSAAE